MIRLWWFGLWLWEWFWHPQGMLIWAEANQGMLSIVALATTAAFALWELNRANKAEGRALQAARDAEAAEERRANDAIEREARFAREAEDRRREGQIDAELQRMAEYATTARSLIRDAELALGTDRAAKLAAAATGATTIFIPSATVSAVARVSAASLEAIVHAAPLDPKLILATQEATMALQLLAATSTAVSAEGVDRWYTGQSDALIAIRGKITGQEMAWTHRLRAPEPFVFEPPAPDSPDAHRSM